MMVGKGRGMRKATQVDTEQQQRQDKTELWVKGKEMGWTLQIKKIFPEQ